MKELLLTKSNFKKKKSISIAIGLIMLLASFLIAISLLLMLDAYPNTERYAKKLNAGDGVSIVYKDLNNIDDNVLNNALKGAKEYEKTEYLFYNTTTVKYADGDTATALLIIDSKVFNKTIEKTEIALEDKNITSNYIYLPYMLYTSGGYKIGDMYHLNQNNKDYKVKGFTSSTSFGCYNSGFFEFILDDISYEELKITLNSNLSYVISYKLNDGINPNKMKLQILNEIQKVNSNSLVDGTTLESIIFNRGFMALILAISFIMVSAILLVVVLLMLVNSISNYIKENMKEIGALKAIGYTSRDIRVSLVLQFLILSIIGSIIGVIVGYLSMPLIGKLIENQQGLLYTVSFNVISVFVPIISIILFTLLLVFLATRKIKKIEPIVALREGLNTHNFKKNRIALDKSKTSLNVSLALKTLFNNLGQNIITFFVVGFMTFTCVVALMMFENFNRNPKIDMLTFETCTGVAAITPDRKDEVYDYLKNRSDITNVKDMISLTIIYGDNEDSLMAYVVDDVNKLNNTNVCYKGRLPKYDNEIVCSGRFLTSNGYDVGDEIEFNYAGNKKKFLITGLIQTTNNGGKEALMSMASASELTDLSNALGYYWFDTKTDAEEVFDDIRALVGDSLVTTMNFDKIIGSAIKNFKSIASVMLISILVISSLVILLVLYLLIKSMMQKKKKEYGILKALGYKSKDLILQTAISFMPSIIISVIIFSIVSYFLTNPYMNLIMINFGIMKCNFVIPIVGVIIVGIMLVIISFLFAIFESRRIKKIEPYNLLLAE